MKIRVPLIVGTGTMRTPDSIALAACALGGVDFAVSKAREAFEDGRRVQWVVKVAESTLMALRVVELAHEAGVPRGVLKVSPGVGEWLGFTWT